MPRCSRCRIQRTHAPAFPQVNNGRLVIGEQCKEFYFAGWNMWEVVELGSNAPSPPFRSTPKKGQEHLLNVMNQGVAAGMKVVRVWAHSITPGWEMQKGPGSYDEKVLKGMDFVMDEAHKRGLKVRFGMRMTHVCACWSLTHAHAPRTQIIWVIADNWCVCGVMRAASFCTAAHTVAAQVPHRRH
jgi:hypothetical protein